MCVVMNLMQIFFKPYTFSIKAYLVNYLSSLFVYHLNCLEFQLELELEDTIQYVFDFKF